MKTVLKTNKRTSFSFSLKRLLMLMVAVMTVMTFFACTGDDPAKEDENGGNGGNGGGNGGNGQGMVWVDKKGGKNETLADLDAALWYLMTSGLGDYTVRIGENQHITSNYNFFMQKGLNVTLKAESGTVEITRKVDLPKHFFVMMEATLTLDKGITLKGLGDSESIENEDGGIEVVEKGKLIMNEGSKLTNFGNKIDGSGAVLILREGVFEMNGGTICDNFSYGVHVGAPDGSDGGTFTMNGGTVSDNGTPTYGLSGVFIDNGTFNMNDGTISGNVCGGVRIEDGKFTMKKGLIVNNIEEKGGGGVCVWDDGIFIMDGGEISGNQTTAEYDGGDGGGVFVAGSFVMNGGTIANNTASNIGGGVFVYTGGIFTMNGGTIAGNTTLTKAGAGVGLYKDATFTKTGNSIIYGLNGGANANIAISGVGYAAYVGSAPPTEAKRDGTAGEGAVIKWPSAQPTADGWDIE